MMRDRLETMRTENVRSLTRLEAMVLLQRHSVDQPYRRQDSQNVVDGRGRYGDDQLAALSEQTSTATDQRSVGRALCTQGPQAS